MQSADQVQILKGNNLSICDARKLVDSPQLCLATGAFISLAVAVCLFYMHTKGLKLHCDQSIISALKHQRFLLASVIPFAVCTCCTFFLSKQICCKIQSNHPEGLPTNKDYSEYKSAQYIGRFNFLISVVSLCLLSVFILLFLACARSRAKSGDPISVSAPLFYCIVGLALIFSAIFPGCNCLLTYSVCDFIEQCLNFLKGSKANSKRLANVKQIALSAGVPEMFFG